MATPTVGPVMSGDIFIGLAPAEKQFLQDLEKFLAQYSGFAGSTPVDQALISTFNLSVTAVGPRASLFVCHKWCVGPNGRLYCCGM